jgi:hypothetical protein
VRKFSRRTTIIASTLALVLVTSVVAYAFWTNNGAGNGSASAGTNTVNVIQTSTPSGLVPGGPGGELTGTFNNPGSAPVTVNNVIATLASVSGGTADPFKPPCTINDFALSGNPAPVTSGPVNPGTNGSWGGIFVALVNDPAENQDNCKGASINITYATN